MSEARQFHMTFAELVDKLTIDQIKEVLLPARRDEYAREIARVEHDLDLLVKDQPVVLSAELTRMLVLLAQANLHIWYNKDSMTSEPDRYMELLKFAQDVNGLRNHVKNLLLDETGEATSASRRVTFLEQGSQEWYTEILSTLRSAPRDTP